ncbi:MerR family transcriptional regulator [Kiloniella spongiae]|uniref:MerR family transcriptional regulator n=1 Tax=Kiloniella spongiae TaxID=1489064 RepID=A0A0H2MWX3_9PROT|nr:MerR family DNA-binding transcriptional regulator [Kiloniella spongiae]KLN61200.1 MerR family transcriptional regulator [Kiloniella spongiae]
MNGQGLHSITELTHEFGITTRTLRFYEGEKLLNPHREGRKRLYSSRDRARLILILRGKRLGFSLAEIREIIEMYDLEPGESGQIQRLLECIAKHRSKLVEKREDIDEILSEMARVTSVASQRLDELKDKTVQQEKT